MVRAHPGASFYIFSLISFIFTFFSLRMPSSFVKFHFLSSWMFYMMLILLLHSTYVLSLNTFCNSFYIRCSCQHPIWCCLWHWLKHFLIFQMRKHLSQARVTSILHFTDTNRRKIKIKSAKKLKSVWQQSDFIQANWQWLNVRRIYFILIFKICEKINFFKQNEM